MTSIYPHFLVAESERPDERAKRRGDVGKSSGETYAATLQQMAPGATIEQIAPADADAPALDIDTLRRFDAVFHTGSPMRAWKSDASVERAVAFVDRVFAAGVPSFGSCAGLQLAVVAAGGRVAPVDGPGEAGIVRRIGATDAGRRHPLLAGRPACWDAAGLHGDETIEAPANAIVLASNSVSRVQALEIRHRNGLFWGVQYHPELSIGEIAAALRRQADGLIEDGLARDLDAVERQAALLDALHDDPGSSALRWELGVDATFAEEEQRRTEIANFLAMIGQTRLSDRAA